MFIQTKDNYIGNFEQISINQLAEYLIATRGETLEFSMRFIDGIVSDLDLLYNREELLSFIELHREKDNNE